MKTKAIAIILVYLCLLQAALLQPIAVKLPPADPVKASRAESKAPAPSSRQVRTVKPKTRREVRPRRENVRSGPHSSEPKPGTGAEKGAPASAKTAPKSYRPPADISEKEYHFISTYLPYAKEVHRKFGVPIHLTLAQAILESGWGTSELARRPFNNFFGLKCPSSRACECICIPLISKEEKDGEKHDQKSYFHAFPVGGARASFLAYGERLRTSARYASLFDTLALPDYKGWAKGIQAAGYATHSAYAYLLIGIIERLDLHQFHRP